MEKCHFYDDKEKFLSLKKKNFWRDFFLIKIFSLFFGKEKQWKIFFLMKILPIERVNGDLDNETCYYKLAEIDDDSIQ